MNTYIGTFPTLTYLDIDKELRKKYDEDDFFFIFDEKLYNLKSFKNHNTNKFDGIYEDIGIRLISDELEDFFVEIYILTGDIDE